MKQYRKNRDIRHRDKGFTLIEMLVTIAIVTLISSMIFVVLSNARRSAYVSKFVQEMHSLQNAFVLYRGAHNDAVPPCAAGTGVCDDYGGSNALDTTLASLVSEGYISKIPHFFAWPNYSTYYVNIKYVKANIINGYTTEYSCSPIPVSFSSWSPGQLSGMMVFITDAKIWFPFGTQYSACTDAPGSGPGEGNGFCTLVQYSNAPSDTSHLYCLPLGLN